MDVTERLIEHWTNANTVFPLHRMVVLCLQGSQNYGLDTPESDVDTKLIVVPSFGDICFNKKPVSTTYVRDNNEHIDFKDVRLALKTFEKQNMNFVEILFTEDYLINDTYMSAWTQLVEQREDIARYNPYRAVKTMLGVATRKYTMMEHETPARKAVIDRHGYDPKELCHLLRIKEFLCRYIEDEPYADCLRSKHPEFLKGIKRGSLNLETARAVAANTFKHIERRANEFCDKTPDECNPKVKELLDFAQEKIMATSLVEELPRIYKFLQ